MGGERNRDEGLEGDAIRKAETYIVKAGRIIDAAKLGDKLELNEEQMLVFLMRFAHSLCLKESQDNKRQRHGQFYIASERLGLRGIVDGIERQIEVDEKAAEILKLQVTEALENYSPKEGWVSGNSVANTANFFTALYINCKEEGKNYMPAVEGSLNHVKKTFLKKDGGY